MIQSKYVITKILQNVSIFFRLCSYKSTNECTYIHGMQLDNLCLVKSIMFIDSVSSLALPQTIKASNQAKLVFIAVLF